MSPSLVARSPDLSRLRSEGYEVAVRDGHLLVSHVPFITPKRQLAYGTLVSVLTLNADAAARPADHVVYFQGEVPSKPDGTPIPNLVNSSGEFQLGPSISAQHMFSNKPDEGFADYFEKMTSYANILRGYAQLLDPDATAQTHVVLEDETSSSVFLYADSASTRAGIVAINEKLRLERVAIVGLGGTGSYILDLLAKTPVQEIHLFDGDRFLQHNAFRAPGAAKLDDFRGMPFKVAYYAEKYGFMRRGIVPHPYAIDEETRTELKEMNFVFVAAEGGPAKRLIVETLEAAQIPFIDVGMGVYPSGEGLAGVIAVTTSTERQRGHVLDRKRIDFADDGDENEYDFNIQIADLNALNAALAIIRWKKLMGFYADFEDEHFSAYTIDGNHLLNEDAP